MRSLSDLQGHVEGSAAHALWLHHRERYRRRTSSATPALLRIPAFLLVVVQWLVAYVLFSFLPKHRFETYGGGETGIYPLEAPQGRPVRLALAGDWGVGTREAAGVAREMAATSPELTIHLGDVYWVGSPSEIKAYCLDETIWPHGSSGSWALNADHEMYGRGWGYYDTFLPTLGPASGGSSELAGQPTSYFAFENRHWRLIALDTGYNSTGKLFVELFTRPGCRLPDPLLQWLDDTVRLGDPDDRRGIILLTHHSNRSAFSSDKNIPLPGQQIAGFLGNQRPVLWFWGHDHRLAFYDLASAEGGVAAYGRCIGNGGMLVDVAETPSDPSSYGLQIYDARVYKQIGEGKLDLSVGFNGYARLSFEGPTLGVEYFTLGEDPDASSVLVARETWTVDPTRGAVNPPRFDFIAPGLTIVPGTVSTAGVGRSVDATAERGSSGREPDKEG